MSHKGKNLGTFSTKAGAENHEREVEYFKSKNEAELPDVGISGVFDDTISGEGPSASPAVTEHDFADLHPLGVHEQKTFSEFVKEHDIDTHADTVPDFEVLEHDEDILPDELVPNYGLTDRLFTEVEDELVPSEIAVDDRLYTESQKMRWRKLR